MDSRRRLVSRVLESGFSVSAASKEAGVSRQTAHVWLARANESGGILGMSELSRRPKNSPCSSSPEIVSQVLEIARQYPFWGAEKLYALLWPEGNAPICQRTVSRILSRSGRRVQPMPEPASEFTRFEREESNELWQLDFKKVGPRKNGKETVSTLDDAKRYCLALEVVPDQTLSSLWSVLWDVFGEYGLPKATLSDNGPAFRNNATWRWSSFDLRLMLLGIKPLHGRPYHPQTQGKVERFHGTIERELDFSQSLEIPTMLREFRDRYNWVRPHQSLNMKTPGSVYKPSQTKRPKQMPEPFFPKEAILRKAVDPGVISYQGNKYKVGRAFNGLPVGILPNEEGLLKIVWGTFILGNLEDFRL